MKEFVFDNNLQILLTIRSFIIGAVFAMLYDVFRVIRKTFNHKGTIGIVIVFFEDLLYFAMVSVIGILFCVSAHHGKIHSGSALFIVLGFLLYYVTIGQVACRLFSAIFIKIKICTGKLLKK